MNPANVVLAINLLPVAIAAGKALFELYDETRADPEAKCEALKKLNRETKAQHEDFMEQFKKSQEEYEAVSRRREAEANARLKTLREENQKNRETLHSELQKQNNRYDSEVKIMNEIHLKRIQEMRSETTEKKNKVEVEHRSKMESLEEEFRCQQKAAEDKLEHTKKEGAQKLAIAEKEKESLIKQRNAELRSYIDIAKQLNEIHRDNLRGIQTRNRNFREENMQLRREQIQTENQARLDDKNQSYDRLMETLVSNNSKGVVREFRKIIKHVVAVETSLENIKNDCLPSHGGAPTILPGRLDEDFKCIKSGVNEFRNCKNTFSQYVINTTLTDPDLLAMCNKLINEMDIYMKAPELSEMCSQLPLTLGKEHLGTEDLRIIKFYAESTKSLHQKFSELSSTVDREVQTIHINHLPEPTNRAITQ